MFDRIIETDRTNHLTRPRISHLLAKAATHPLVIVRAGAGYGKTRAALDFVHGSKLPFTWLQCSERDNAGSRFWVKYTKVIAGWNTAFVEHCENSGFPDTEDKINRHIDMRKSYATRERRLIVLDDVHLIRHPAVLHFLERGLSEAVKNTSVILICRELPNIDLAEIQIRGFTPTLTEEDLSFTESELERYLGQQGLCMPRQSVRDILEDTNGWAFAVNLVARSLKKSPGYEGYVKVAMKRNIFRLMQTEGYDAVSVRLQRFLVRLSLIDHLSAGLITQLAGGDEELLAELSRQNAYLRYDGYINAYLIHQLFLEFLRSRQGILTCEERLSTYRTAALWCAQNGFEIDALGYYEKVGDYGEIVAVLRRFPVQMSYDIAIFAVGIFERAPAGLPGRLEFFAVMHVRVLTRLGRWGDALALLKKYEERMLRLKDDDPFKNRTLGVLYYTWGNLRALLGTTDGRYDFDSYYAKMDACLAKAPVEPDQYADMPIGFWASLTGSPREGAPREYIEAATRTVQYVTGCWRGATAGIDVLCRGELMFYQGNLREAEPLIAAAQRRARNARQFETEHKALFYLLRLALWRGDCVKAEQFLGEMENRLNEKKYYHRFYNYDAGLAWYFCALRRPDMAPAWLKEKFSAYSHAYYIENTGNQIKARYHYQTRNYTALLAYIADMRQRESILFGRVEMLALEACAYYKMKDKAAAFRSLYEAYEAAFPNGILAPFIELGKDMRTLVSACLREPDTNLPHEWLDALRRGSSSFAKLQSLMVSEYEKLHGYNRDTVLSAREREILKDLYAGLSRAEIAAKQALSINTVNASVNSVLNKLGAHNTLDAVRIAAEENLV